MKVKRILLSVLAAVVLMSVSMTASAQSSTSTGTGSITVDDNGYLSVQFCWAANFKVGSSDSPTNGGDPSVTSSEGAHTWANTSICYVDSEAGRGAFTTTITATDFEHQTPGVSATIPSSNLYLRRVVRPRMDVGTTILSNSGMIYAVAGTSEITTYPGTNGSSVYWPVHSRDLSIPVVVGRADAGRGMSNSLDAQIRAGLYFDLVVPAGQKPGLYKSQFTVTIAPAVP